MPPLALKVHITGEKSEVIQGVAYQDKLFTRLKIYAEDEQEKAITVSISSSIAHGSRHWTNV